MLENRLNALLFKLCRQISFLLILILLINNYMLSPNEKGAFTVVTLFVIKVNVYFWKCSIYIYDMAFFSVSNDSEQFLYWIPKL